MSEPLKPALKPEDWASRGVMFGSRGAAVLRGSTLTVGWDSEGVSMEGRERHALAALALHGQPFGFTWEMVDALREALVRSEGNDHADQWMGERGRLAFTALENLAALLPPREP